jgi:hypothetical protein
MDRYRFEADLKPGADAPTLAADRIYARDAAHSSKEEHRDISKDKEDDHHGRKEKEK